MALPQFSPGQVLPGTVYRVVRHLATGGMGSVYEVEDVTVEKRYVVKTLHPNLLAREDLAARMRDEAKSLARLSHPNIVDVVTAGVTTEATPLPFFVMERLVGQNLRTVLDKVGHLRPAYAYRIAIEVADALAHAHERNIVHRDVKPENIFLHRSPNGVTTTKLLDFGIVRLLDRTETKTQGKFLGTLRYASPEQIVGEALGPETDLYSLGAVLFEMLCGRGPFDDEVDAFAVATAHVRTPAPRLATFVRGLPNELELLVDAVLSKAPAQRPRNAAAFATELRQIFADEELSPRSVVLLSAPSFPPSRTKSASFAPPTATASQTVPETFVPPESDRAPSPEPRESDGEPVSPVAPTVAAEGGTLVLIDRPLLARKLDRNAPTRQSELPLRSPVVPRNGTVAAESVVLARIDKAPPAFADAVATKSRAWPQVFVAVLVFLGACAVAAAIAFGRRATTKLPPGAMPSARSTDVRFDP